MNNGDDIHNLLKTLGHDAGLYQDLAKYNASRAAVRRAAMGRPTDPVAAAVAPAPTLAPVREQRPPEPPNGQATPTGTASLSSILNRLASPHDPGLPHGARSGSAADMRPAPGVAAVLPTRLDRLFGRLATRGSAR